MNWLKRKLIRWHSGRIVKLGGSAIVNCELNGQFNHILPKSKVTDGGYMFYHTVDFDTITYDENTGGVHFPSKRIQ